MKTRMNNGELYYYEDFYTSEKAWTLFHFLDQEVQFEQKSISLYGKSFMSPRLEAFYSKNGEEYSYSGKNLKSQLFTKELYQICEDIEHFTKTTFNSVLINMYRDGQDSNGWHSDDERELGKNPIIASLSLGEMRRIHFKHNTLKERFFIDMNHGSLLLMKGSLQHYWKHHVPKSKKVKSKRINLTFRTIMS